MFDLYFLACIAPLVLCVFLAVDLGAVNTEKSWQRAFILAICAVVLVIEFFIISMVSESDKDMATLVMLPMMAIPYMVLRRLTWPQQIFTFCMIAIAVHLSCMAPFINVPETAGFSVWTRICIGICTALVMAALIHFALSKPFKAFTASVTEGWTAPCLCAVVGGLILFAYSFVAPLDRLEYVLLDLIFTIYLALICISTIFVMKKMSSVAIKEHDLEIFRDHSLKQQEISQLQSDMIKEERRRRHDQRHALQVIIDELNEGNISDAIAHLETMRGESPNKALQYCKNEIVNASLSLWAGKAMEEEIDVSIRADVPAEISIEPLNLSTIFGNILENAYEGCMRLERTEAHRYIKVLCICANGRLNLRVENSCRHDIAFIDGMPQTQKRGGGIGTSSVKNTVEKLGGMCKFSSHEGTFETSVILPL